MSKIQGSSTDFQQSEGKNGNRAANYKLGGPRNGEILRNKSGSNNNGGVKSGVLRTVGTSFNTCSDGENKTNPKKLLSFKKVDEIVKDL